MPVSSVSILPPQPAFWASQVDWAISPTTGSDNSIGNAASPLRTAAELFFRLPPGTRIPAGHTVKISIQGSLPPTDGLYIDWILEDGAQVWIDGTAGTTTTSSGTLTAATNLARPVPQDVTGAAGVAAFVGKRIRFTASGKSCWLVKDLGANKIRTTPVCAAFTLPGISIPTVTTLAGNEAYVTETFPTVSVGIVRLSPLRADGTLSNNFLTISNVTMFNAGGSGFFIDLPTNCFASVVSSIIQSSVNAGMGAVIFANCLLTSGGATNGDYFCLAGGSLGIAYFAGGASIGAGLGLLFDQDYLVQGGGGYKIGRGAFAKFGTFALFDSTADGLTIRPDSIPCVSELFLAGTDLIYGSGSTGVGIRVGAGNGLFYTTKPSLTGAAGDTQIGSAAITPYAAIPFLYPPNGAQMSVLF